MNGNDIIRAKREAYSEAYENALSLSDLISPSDVIEGADRWRDISDERLDGEVAECLTHVRSEGQYSGIVRDLAVKTWMGDLPRAPMEDLAFDDKRTAVENGYWPNSMNKWECEEILFEMEIPPMVRDEAWEVVSRGVGDKLHPGRAKDY